jgi:hypothetical protein
MEMLFLIASWWQENSGERKKDSGPDAPMLSAEIYELIYGFQLRCVGPPIDY